MEVSTKVHEICTGARGSPNVVIDVVEKVNGVGTHLQPNNKKPQQNVSNKKTGVVGIHKSAHGYIRREETERSQKKHCRDYGHVLPGGKY